MMDYLTPGAKDLMVITIAQGTLDPTNSFNASYTSLVEVLGFLPFYIHEEGDTLMDKINAGYGKTAGFEPHWETLFEHNPNAKVLEDGTYLYPEDEPLAPVWTYAEGDTIYNIYQYGIVLLLEEDVWHFARLD